MTTEIIKANGEIVGAEQSDGRRTHTNPTLVLAEAARAATALKDVLDKKPKKIMMGDEQYLEFEDWQTLARFYDLTAKEDGDPEFVHIGDATGFKASAVVLDAGGVVVSRATAYCLTDEEKWGSRPKYAWVYVLRDGSHSAQDPGADNLLWEANPNKPGKKRPKKERILVGEEKVPLYQLASMAQTRSCAKALRNVLSWVAVLAGYRPTPAEEISGQAQASQPPPRQEEQALPVNYDCPPDYSTLSRWIDLAAAKLTRESYPATAAVLGDRVRGLVERSGVKTAPHQWNATALQIAASALREVCADIRAPKAAVNDTEVVAAAPLARIERLLRDAAAPWETVRDALKLPAHSSPPTLAPDQAQRVIAVLEEELAKMHDGAAIPY